MGITQQWKAFWARREVIALLDEKEEGRYERDDAKQPRRRGGKVRKEMIKVHE